MNVMRLINEATRTKESDNIVTKLLKTDNNMSMSGFFLFLTSVIGIVLLAVPAIAILVELYYTHTVSLDLSGMAAYIGAVVTLFATGGLTYASTRYSVNKFVNSQPGENIICEDEEFQED